MQVGRLTRSELQAWARGDIKSVMKSTEQALGAFTVTMLATSIATCALVASAIAQQTSGGPRPQIDDHAGLDCFLAAKRETSNAAKAVKLESCLQQYPDSATNEEALEILLDTYEHLGDLKRVDATGGRLLQQNPESLLGLWTRAGLFFYTDFDRPGSYQESAELAKRGLRVLGEAAKPKGMSAADFEKRKSAMSSTFNGVAGSVALRMKDFSNAQRYLRAAIDSEPDNFGNVYQLALAYLQSEPAEPAQGLFFVARAANLAPAAVREKLDAYGKEQCLKYYGSDRRWVSIKAIAKTRATPPLNFTIDEVRIDEARHP